MRRAFVHRLHICVVVWHVMWHIIKNVKYCSHILHNYHPEVPPPPTHTPPNPLSTPFHHDPFHIPRCLLLLKNLYFINPEGKVCIYLGMQAGAGTHPAALEIYLHQGGHLLLVLAVSSNQHHGGGRHYPESGILEHLRGQ